MPPNQTGDSSPQRSFARCMAAGAKLLQSDFQLSPEGGNLVWIGPRSAINRCGRIAFPFERTRTGRRALGRERAAQIPRPTTGTSWQLP